MRRLPTLLGICLLSSGCLGNVQVRRIKSFSQLKYPFPVTYASFGGLKLAYADQGKGKDVLLLLPPAMSSIKIWRHLIAHLAKTHRVIALDLPGHGKSSKPRFFRYHPNTYAEVVDRFLSHLKIPYVNLVGHSNGGATALSFALKFPRRLRRIVLVAPGSVEPASPLKQRMLRWGATPTHLATLNPYFTKLGLEMFVFGKTGKFSDTYASDLLAIRGAGKEYRAWLRAQIRTLRATTGFGVGDQASKITVPALILWGEKDRVVPVEVGRRLRKRMKKAQLVVLPGVGHMPELEVPAAVNRLVAGFLKRTASAPIPPGPAPGKKPGSSDDDDE